MSTRFHHHVPQAQDPLYLQKAPDYDKAHWAQDSPVPPKTLNPNQVWAMDITFIPMAKAFVYLKCVMDNRKILSSVISNTLDASYSVDAYIEAVRLYGSPEIINTDQGSQFTSDAFVAAVAASGARRSMDGKGAWTDNIFMERFWRSLMNDEVYMRAYETVPDAKRR